MLRVTDADERTSCRFALCGALTEGGRIGETAMIEYIVDVEPLYSRLHSVEFHTLQRGCVDFVVHRQTAYLEVLSRLPIIEVEAYFRTVKAQVELLSLLFRTVEEWVFNVDGVAKEYPSPPQIGTYAYRWFGCEGQMVALLVVQYIHFKVVGVLYHRRKVVPLRFNVGGIDVVHLAHRLSDIAQMSVEPAFCGVGSLPLHTVEALPLCAFGYGFPTAFCPCCGGEKQHQQAEYDGFDGHSVSICLRFCPLPSW